MRYILTITAITLFFNSCSTNKACNDCTTKIPEPKNLKSEKNQTFSGSFSVVIEKK